MRYISGEAPLVSGPQMRARKAISGPTSWNRVDEYCDAAAAGCLRQKNLAAAIDSRVQLFFQRTCCTRKRRIVAGTIVSQVAVDWYTTRQLRSRALVSA